ncbi:MAG: 4-alpha-glucanotransferase [Opitutia bacterium UBA7350]|nr:MAG: 4-alpha-glucanotransferase [Opitutae bacterium UBA7350]
MPKTPFYQWLHHRAAGVLLHPSSLPAPTGIGNFGKGAYQFIDALSENGFRVWQMCPLGPTGFGDSPYQCFSAFAGNPYFIDFDPLLEAGLIDAQALSNLRGLPTKRCDFGGLYEGFWPVLEKAHIQFTENNSKRLADYEPYAEFRAAEAHWLEDYSSFMGLKTHFNGQCWLDWPRKFRDAHRSDAWKLPEAALAQKEMHAFAQYLFSAQYKKFRAYAEKKGVGIMGDLPIFVALDSADVWANQNLFQLKANGQPLAVAGVPPDYFAVDGQLWGNPLYAWEEHAANGFAWWLERLQANLKLYDYLRIDHFRGFESYWSVPAEAATAREGTWKPAPGLALFQAIAEAFPEARIIAEDLGVITPEVKALMAQTGLPGMAVLQFAFGDDADNAYLPHNLQPNSVLYTGTHDNDTSIGWYSQADPATRDHVRRYYGISGENIGWDFIRSALRSTANLAIVPLQDLLSLDSEARLNTPGRAEGNWQWRFHTEDLQQFQKTSGAYIKELNALYGRLPSSRP